MRLWDSEKSAEIWYTIKSNKRRSVITSLGVFFGMLFFTIMLSIGVGVENALNRSISSASNNMYFLDLGPTTLPYQGYATKRQLNFTYSDMVNIAARSQLLDKCAGSALWHRTGGGWDRVVRTTQGKSEDIMLIGVSPQYYDIMSVNIEAGRIMQSEEIADAHPICLMGKEWATRLYGSPEKAVGETITTGGLAFKIVGVTSNKSIMQIGMSPEWNIFVPIGYVTGNDPNANIFMYALPKAGVGDEAVKQEVFDYISQRYHVHPNDKGVISIMNTREVYEFMGMISNGINLLVWLIGMGTLLTGVISVSNILLVTVRERQREIGVRRAVGAKPRNIIEQFISEAILIISLAGFGGMLLGLVVVLGIGAASETGGTLSKIIWHPYPSVGLLLLAVIIILIAGVLAGLLPVYKALQVKAIDAIRDE